MSTATTARREYTAAEIADLTRRADAGSNVANDILGGILARETLWAAHRVVTWKINKGGDVKPEFIASIARRVAYAAEVSTIRDAYAASYGRNAVYYTYRAGGLDSVLREVTRRIETSNLSLPYADETA